SRAVKPPNGADSAPLTVNGDRLAQIRLACGYPAGRLQRRGADWPIPLTAGEQPGSRLSQSPVGPKDAQELGRQHDVAVLAALAVFDPNDHAAAVDVANLEGGHLADAQPRAISCSQSRPVAQPRHCPQEAGDLLAAEHHRQ